MKRYIVKIIIFIIVLFVLDIAFGQFFTYLIQNAKSGNGYRNNYIAYSICEDVIIYGSSRAVYHYNPLIIEGHTDYSCYNCGQDGNGIILAYARYQLLRRRYKPNLVIYDISPGFDLFEGDNHKSLGWLKPYYDLPGISEIFALVDNKECLKMRCQMYRYNSKLVQAITDYALVKQDDEIKGFRPQDKTMDALKVSKREVIDYPYDSLKLVLFEKMIELSKDTKFVFVVSPYYNGYYTEYLKPFHDICKKYSIPLYDFSNSTDFLYKKELFFDGAHLNSKGANYFTEILVEALKKDKII